MMEHQYVPTEAIGADFKGGAVSGERIETAIPRGLTSILRSRVLQVVLAVIKHELETPILRQRAWRGRCQVGKIGTAVAVEDILDVSLGRASCVAAVAFV